jgi:hypothetical protein
MEVDACSRCRRQILVVIIGCSCQRQMRRVAVGSRKRRDGNDSGQEQDVAAQSLKISLDKHSM